MKKKFKSIDGYFEKFLDIENIKNLNNLPKNHISSIVGQGNSISKIPYANNVKLNNLDLINNFKLNRKKKLLEANGNATILDIHNFLIKNNYVCHYFPSYPLVSLGGCIANGSHGIMPKKGIFNDFVVSMKVYNPNFGFKELSNKKNINLFNLTKSGFGLTGIIVSAKIKISKLSGTKVKIKQHKFNDIYNCYKFMKKSKDIYNQNSFLVNSSSKKVFKGRLITGQIINKKNTFQKLEINKIPHLRLGIFNFHFVKNIIFNLIFILENIKIFFKKTQHINDILFTSNKRTGYFFLMPKKFIEYQNIVPHKYVKIYLNNLENLIKKNKPNITLLHLKIFAGKSKNLEFRKEGLAIAMHIVNDKIFNMFFKELIYLDKKYNCEICIYKNSEINLRLLKYFYNKRLKQFMKSVNKINTKYKFTNNLFGSNV